MGRPKFDMPDPVGSEDDDGKPLPPGSGAAAPGADAPKSKRPVFEMPDPVEDDASEPEASWEDVLLSYAEGASLGHGDIGENLGNSLADLKGYLSGDDSAATRRENAIRVGGGAIDQIPDAASTRSAKMLGNLTTTLPAAYLAGPSMAAQAALGAGTGLVSAHGEGESMGRGALLGGVTGALGAHLGKGLSAVGGALGKALTPKSTQLALEYGGKNAGNSLSEVLKSSGLGTVLRGAAAGAGLAHVTGNDWKQGALGGALTGGALKGAKSTGADKGIAGKILGQLAPLAGKGLDALSRYGAQFAAPLVAGGADMAPSNDAALSWSLQSVLYSGNTGLPQADEEKLTEAVASGDTDRIKATNYQMQMKHPEYAAKVRGQLESVQREE